MDNRALLDIDRRLKRLDGKPDIRLGEVTDDAPLMIALGGDTSSVEARIITGGEVEVGDYVWVLLAGSRPPLILAGGGKGGVTLPIAQSDVTGLVAALANLNPYTQSIGNGSSTTFTVTHSKGTKDVRVTVFRNSDGQEGWATVARPTTNTVTVTFGTAPSSNQYRVVVA